MTTLAELGIRLPRGRPGEHRCPCPVCAEAKSRPGDDALAVKVEPDGGATWKCQRCGWTGGFPAPGAGRSSPYRPSPSPRHAAEPTGFPEVAARLWASRRPIGAGTVAGRYLTGRGCALPPPDGD